MKTCFVLNNFSYRFVGFFPKKLPDIVKQFLGSSGFWRVYSNLIVLELYAFFALVIRNVLPFELFWCTPREPPTYLLLDFLKSVNKVVKETYDSVEVIRAKLYEFWQSCSPCARHDILLVTPKCHLAFSDLRCAYISACYAFSFLLTYTPLKPISSSYDNDG